MHLPAIPLDSFRRLVGAELSRQLDELRARAGDEKIVLFSDLHGERLALLTVGAGRRFERLEDVVVAEIDGMRALCSLDASAKTAEAPHSADFEDSLRQREQFLEECEQRLADAGQRLSEREALLEQREQTVLSKERELARGAGGAAG